MNIIDQTDEELLKIGIPWWEDLIKYSNKGQYGKFIRNFSYDCSHKRAPVPKATERPVLGLKTDKNFIVCNAIQNILSNAKKIASPPNYL